MKYLSYILGTKNGYQIMWKKDMILKQLIKLKYDMPIIQMKHLPSMVHLVII